MLGSTVNSQWWLGQWDIFEPPLYFTISKNDTNLIQTNIHIGIYSNIQISVTPCCRATCSSVVAGTGGAPFRRPSTHSGANDARREPAKKRHKKADG